MDFYWLSLGDGKEVTEDFLNRYFKESPEFIGKTLIDKVIRKKGLLIRILL